MKRILLFLIAATVLNGCIKPDSFDLGDDLGVMTSVEAKAPLLLYGEEQQQTMQLYWADNDAMDIYYTARSEWSNFKFENGQGDEPVSVELFGEQSWKRNVRSHIFYAMHPAQGLGADSEVDPSVVELTLPNVQYYNKGTASYMVSSCAVKVDGGDPVSFQLEPSLALLELNLTAKSNFILKTIKLALSGATGKAIVGDYKLDVTDNSINSRQATGREVTIDFGEGLAMTSDNTYKAYAVILPSKIEGAKFTISGTTAASSVELVVVPTADYKKGNIYRLSADIVPGPISREYIWAATSGSYGMSGGNTNMLSFQGLLSTLTTTNKGITISDSKVEELHEGGTIVKNDIYWEATAPDWVILSRYSGTGAANIDVFVTPNIKPITTTDSGTTIDLSQTSTANSYMVNSPGKYKFSVAVMGNGNAGIIEGAKFEDYNGSQITTAAISGMSYAKILWQDMAGMLTEVKLIGSNIEFTTASKIYPGNAVIALYDTANKIIWSWHIWFTNPVSTDKIINANTNTVAIDAKENIFYLMDRNMGALGLTAEVVLQSSARNGNIVITQYTDETKAVPTGKSFSVPIYQIGIASSNDYKIIFGGGLKYQWGRKDPFMMPYSSNRAMVKFDADNNEMPNNINTVEAKVSLAVTILSPDTYVNASSNWTTPSNNYLWGNIVKAGYTVTDYIHADNQSGVKTIYDPCPAGYMVMPLDAISALSETAKVGSFGAAEFSGYYMKTYPTDPTGILFAATGYISSKGATLDLMKQGVYYTNGANSTADSFAYQMQIINTGAGVSNLRNQSKGNGNNVRCIKL